MKWTKLLAGFAVVLAAAGVVCPQPLLAGQQKQAKQRLQIREAGTIQLHAGGVVRGALVDGNGSGVAKAPVVAVSGGRVVGKTQTNDEGTFTFKGLQPGKHLIATNDGIYEYQLASGSTDGQTLRQGAIIKVDPETARGAWGVGTAGLIATLVIAGIVAGIIIATEDDDDDAS